MKTECEHSKQSASTFQCAGTLSRVASGAKCEAVRDAGGTPLIGVIEHTSALVKAMNLENRAGGGRIAEAFLQELRAALKPRKNG